MTAAAEEAPAKAEKVRGTPTPNLTTHPLPRIHHRQRAPVPHAARARRPPRDACYIHQVPLRNERIRTLFYILLAPVVRPLTL
jgi:hypothetical protein